ncbi:MAG: KamA family radical SAM protein [Puniceicoccales bacterium]|jgi:lysine 2,3-aminomutase|nr:KamA family radical SAM protein [Puniceicoccales bacterium]
MHPSDHLENWFQGQGHWASTPPGQWQSWAWQLQNRLTSPAHFERHLTLSGEERQGFRHAANRLSVAITPYFFNLVDPADPECPIRRQVVPRGAEALVSPGESPDPIGEEAASPVPGLVHRYPDRVLLMATNQCAGYCRYCTRGRLVSNAADHHFLPRHEQALDYIRRHEEVRDVLLSGGDPLLLPDSRLDELLGALRAIPHVEFLRIGTRVPGFLPQRVTPALCGVLRKHGPVWLSLHFNHPRECTREAREATERLALAGCPMGSQSVLLRGVNDDAQTLRSLFHRLLMMRVHPYYLYACDCITGSAHLRVPVSRGIELIRSLRGHTTGYAVPQFVIDAPGGGGKVPVNPGYIAESGPGERTVVRSYRGTLHEYPG